MPITPVNTFESSVISYSSKTKEVVEQGYKPFESSVISYSSKTTM